MSAFFYRDNSGTEIGPFESDTMTKLRAGGVLNDSTLVRSEDSTDWRPYSAIIAIRATSTVKSAATRSEPSSFKAGARNLHSWGVVAVAVGIVLFLIVWPSIQKSIQTKNENRVKLQVVHDLDQIESAKYQWALEHSKSLSAIPIEEELSPYFFNTHDFPKHPPGGSYVINALKDLPASTIYGTRLDIEASLPTNASISKTMLDTEHQQEAENRLKILKDIQKIGGD